MPTYLYRPECPDADEYGHVEKSIALEWDYYNSPDNGAVIGNKRVQLNFISDYMPDTRHMCDGKYYNSKEQFRKATKAAGCIEFGNDSSIMNPKPKKVPELDRRQRREDIRKAIHQVKNGKKA